MANYEFFIDLNMKLVTWTVILKHILRLNGASNYATLVSIILTFDSIYLARPWKRQLVLKFIAQA